MVQLKVTIRTAPRDLHSGLYGGSVLNATHVMHAMLAEILPGPDGRLRPELRAGILEPSPDEVRSWSHLPAGSEVISEVGGRPLDENSARDYYRHNWADASIDVNGFAGGDAVQRRTIVPATAQVVVSMRLAPGQDSEQMAKVLQELMLSAAPDGTEVVEVLMDRGDPAVFDPATPALQLAQSAIERATGKAPALVRSGGSIGVLAAFAKRNIPVVLSGFSLAEDAYHAPDESFRIESLRLGEASARALYEELAKLPH
jgi:acetylornithine deacetylase/succinyl-diaminopimelate desuccinylase-like protein